MCWVPTGYSRRWIIGLFGAALCGMPLQAAVLVTDPGGLNSPINSLNKAMSASYGNVTLSDFNANLLGGQRHIRSYVFTGEASDGYAATAYKGHSNRLTQAVSGIDMFVSFSSTAPYFTLASDGNNAFFTSGSQAWMISASSGNPTVSMLQFSAGVDVVAFTINRLVDNATIRVWSDTGATQQIGTSYALAPNLNPNNSFFGFERGNNSQIRAITIDFAGGGGQFSLDDISFAMYIPEPSTAAFFVFGPLLLRMLHRRRSRLMVARG